jgi:hypothetical protein
MESCGAAIASALGEEYAASRTAARVVRAETVHCPCGLIAIDEDWPTRKLRPELAETVRDDAAF